MPKRKKKPNTATTNNYPVSNDDLMPEIFLYRRTGLVSEEFGRLLLTIAKNLSNKGSFHGYTWKEDMISDGVMTCIKYMYNFDPVRYEAPNPFAYFTSVIRNSFLNYIKKQKKHSFIKDICYKKCSELDTEVPHENYEAIGIDYTLLIKDGKDETQT